MVSSKSSYNFENLLTVHRSSSSFLEVPSTEDDEDFAANVQGGYNDRGGRAAQGGVDGGESSLYYDGDFVDGGMDIEAF